MFNSQTTNNQHQVKFEPTVKLAVYTVDYPIYSQSQQSESRDRRSIRHSNIAFIPHHDRITIQNCENSNLIMNTSTGMDFVSTIDTVPSQHFFVHISYKIPSSENSQMDRNENTASRRSFGDGRNKGIPWNMILFDSFSIFRFEFTRIK